MKVSLWLIPPKHIYKPLEKEIQELAKIDKTPTFLPHITIASGYVEQAVESHKLPQIIQNLKESFSNFGAIPCTFDKDLGIVEGYNQEKQEYQWNQSTVAILKREQKFMQSIFLARKILFDDEKGFEARMAMNSFDNVDFQDTFRPPTNEPHLSFAYSTKPLARFVKYYPEDFESTELALFETDPSSLDGVKNWKEIARIKWST
ncbi:hypothetical protein CTEN210_18283 [Chaetoceros tenuissimus]|uniref:2',3'-cyclic-nucleotide 3'-phosphodiesterase n=1 Tax=Chaetoceros tenuissimus TaxID=426638 RepID=A0AAD3DD63_9STRA|nr:hypothetical protein CTEN210_18283 [Chaetoceros tenuissimus]